MTAGLNDKQPLSVFAERLKTLRDEAGISQGQLGEELGISRGSISFYENTDRTADAVTLAKLSRHFNVSADWLLGLSGCRTMEADTQAVCKKTGLSDYVVEYLAGMSGDKTAIINQMIERDDGFSLDWLLEEIVALKKRVDAAGEKVVYSWEHEVAKIKSLENDLNADVVARSDGRMVAVGMDDYVTLRKAKLQSIFIHAVEDYTNCNIFNQIASAPSPWDLEQMDQGAKKGGQDDGDNS